MTEVPVPPPVDIVCDDCGTVMRVEFLSWQYEEKGPRGVPLLKVEPTLASTRLIERHRRTCPSFRVN